MGRGRRWTDAQLRAAVATATTFKDVLRSLGLASPGGSHWDVRQRIEILGLDTSHFRYPLRGRRAWSDADLSTAVAKSSSYADVVRSLGLELDTRTYSRIQRRIRLLRLDTSHFRRERSRPARPTRWTDENLRAAVQQARSYAGVLRALGLVPAGGNYAQVKRRISELAVDTSHFTGMRWNRGGTSVRGATRSLDELLVANRWTNTHKLKQRLFRAGLKEPRCELCGWAERAPDGRIPVELDHINGDRTDNRLVNLRVLCPNCHALQPTHRGLNRRRPSLQ
jgi:hypothetical protein